MTLSKKTAFSMSTKDLRPEAAPSQASSFNSNVTAPAGRGRGGGGTVGGGAASGGGSAAVGGGGGEAARPPEDAAHRSSALVDALRRWAPSRLVRSLVLLLLYYALVGATFTTLEDGLSLLDAIYFATVLMSTVGCAQRTHTHAHRCPATYARAAIMRLDSRRADGDIQPTTGWTRVLTVVYAIVGIVLFFLHGSRLAIELSTLARCRSLLTSRVRSFARAVAWIFDAMVAPITGWMHRQLEASFPGRPSCFIPSHMVLRSSQPNCRPMRPSHPSPLRRASRRRSCTSRASVAT
jgi:hypothetical protein